MEGQPEPFSDESFATISDVAEIRKIYKLASGTAKQGDSADSHISNDERKELETAILGIIALRGAT